MSNDTIAQADFEGLEFVRIEKTNRENYFKIEIREHPD